MPRTVRATLAMSAESTRCTRSWSRYGGAKPSPQPEGKKPPSTQVKFPGVPSHVETLKWQVAVELPASSGADSSETSEPWRLVIVESSHFQGVPYCTAFAVETVWIVEAEEPTGDSAAEADESERALVRVFFRIKYGIDFPGFVRKVRLTQIHANSCR